MTSPPVKREMLTTFSPRAWPKSADTGGQPMRSSTPSFSASTTRHVLPKVHLSFRCGRKPATLRRYSRHHRPIEVLAWKPSRSAPCSKLNARSLMMGPLMTIRVSEPGVLPECSTP